MTRRRQTRRPAPFCDCAFPVISAALNVRKPTIGDVQFPPTRRAARLYRRDDIYRRWIWSRQPLIDDGRSVDRPDRYVRWRTDCSLYCAQTGGPRRAQVQRAAISPKSLCALAHRLLVVLRPDWRSPTGTGSAGSYSKPSSGATIHRAGGSFDQSFRQC